MHNNCVVGLVRNSEHSNERMRGDKLIIKIDAMEEEKKSAALLSGEAS